MRMGGIFAKKIHNKWDNDDPTSSNAFADKYKKAIIFLVVILCLAVILIALYFLIKKEMCNCFGSKKKDDDEEAGLYDSADEEEALNNGDAKTDETFTNGDLPPPIDEQPSPEHLPEILITESSFQAEKKPKKGLKSIFKRKNKNKGSSVTFSDADERTALVDAPIGSYDSHYGTTLTPLRRTDSMESFTSTMSTATTNAEEFTGEELSPSRIQVSIEYDPKKWALKVGAKQSECLITTNKEPMYWQVHITLLPFKKHRFKTRYKSSSTPVFNQTFDIENIAQQALTQLSVRYRVYGRPGRTGRKKLAGETEVELSHIMSMEDYIIKDWRVLKRKTVGHERRESSV